MTRWWTSDLHLGHTNIIRYSDRPFPDAEAMNEWLIDAWNATVAPGDEVWVLGDFILSRLSERLSFTGELQGRKILVPGNHDACWDGHHKGYERWTQRYLDAGFAEVRQGPLSAEVEGRTVVVSHFPYRGDSRDVERYLDARPPDRGRWLLHGHVHEKWRQQGRQINVGVDAWGGHPVDDATLAALMDAGEQELAPLAWRHPALPAV